MKVVLNIQKAMAKNSGKLEMIMVINQMDIGEHIRMMVLIWKTLLGGRIEEEVKEGGEEEESVEISETKITHTDKQTLTLFLIVLSQI